MLNNNKIQIAMLDISSQNKAILEFYFSHNGDDYYSLVSQENADAFISDYDYPGAKDSTQKALDNGKPVIIISIKEQSIPSTIWLAKPLSATELTNAASEIKQMIEDIKVPVEMAPTPVEMTPTPVEMTPTPVEMTPTPVEMTINKDTDDGIFELLSEEDDTSLDEEKSNTKSLLGVAAMSAAALAATTGSSLIENTSDASLNSESGLDLSDILNDSDDISLDTDGDVDSLLESLISGKGNKKDHQILTSEVDTEENILLEESFTLHNDLSPSTEDIYSQTLEIDYQDLKNDQSSDELINIVDFSAESKRNDITLNSTSSEGLDDLLDFDFDLDRDLETDDSETDDSLEIIDESFKISDDPLELYADIIDLADTPIETPETSLDLSNDSLPTNNSLPTEEDSTETVELSLELEDEVSLELTDQTTNPTPTNNEQDTDLDILLKEISTQEEIEKKPPVETVKEVIPETPTKKVDEPVITANDDLGSIDENAPEIDLESLLEEVREEADKNARNQAMGFVGERDTKEQNSHEKTKAEKRWIHLCGDIPEIKNQKEAVNISYDAEKYLLGVLQEQISSAKNSEQLFRLKYDDLIIVIDCSENKIYCNQSIATDEYASICNTPVSANDIKVHDLDYSEVRLYRSKIKENPNRSHTIESFLWTTSLLTARGRLPAGTEVTKIVGLKVWPNLTRIELMPHAMHMAAVFSKHPGNLLDIAKWLNIHQRYVFAFYNASLSLNMIESDTKILKKKKSSATFNKKDSNKKSEERGFFGRLLKRLRS